MPATGSSAPGHKQTFADAFNPKNNAFGFLRLALATLVIYSHSYPLGGFGKDALEAFTGHRHTIGLVAVSMFFVLSGFLICRSASTATSIPRFLWHRFLRIFPGYWACLIVCGCLFAPLVALYEHGVFFRIFAIEGGNSPQAYVLGNFALFHWKELSIPAVVNISPQSIAGLLSRNPYPFLINGALWTLPIEVSCYVAVAAMAALGALRRAPWFLIVAFVGCWRFMRGLTSPRRAS